MVCGEHSKKKQMWLVHNQISSMVWTLLKKNAGFFRASNITGGIYFQFFRFAIVWVSDSHYDILEFFKYVADT